VNFVNRSEELASLHLVLDEFPELIKASPALPEIMRAFLDHLGEQSRLKIILSGSAIRAAEEIREVPAFVSDDSDRQIAHLHGLNLSRAWCWRRLAELLPADDPRGPVLTDAATRHAEPELAHTSGSDYIVEHWLAAYAVLYLT
jgi:hypothetical protein